MFLWTRGLRFKSPPQHLLQYLCKKKKRLNSLFPFFANLISFFLPIAVSPLSLRNSLIYMTPAFLPLVEFRKWIPSHSLEPYPSTVSSWLCIELHGIKQLCTKLIEFEYIERWMIIKIQDKPRVQGTWALPTSQAVIRFPEYCLPSPFPSALPSIYNQLS